jgi:hypothetical protein
MRFADLVQQTLARAGPYCPPRLLWMLDGAVNYLHAGWWMRSRGFGVEQFLATKEQIFEAAADRIGGRNPRNAFDS